MVRARSASGLAFASASGRKNPRSILSLCATRTLGPEVRGNIMASLSVVVHALAMFTVNDEDAAAIRAAFERGGEFAAAVELRRRFPLIEDNAQARTHARIIAGWQPVSVPLHPAKPPGTRSRRMTWHVIYEGQNGQVESRAARSRDLAIQMACELSQQSCAVHRAIGPDGATIERAELEALYDEGRFPALR